MSKITKRSSKYDPAFKYVPGAYSTLTNGLITQIEVMVKDGKKNVEIYNSLGIPFTTWYSWLSRNTKELANKIREWRREYLLDAAEQELSKLITEPNPRIRLDVVKHLTETLGKQWYSKRNEITGRGGEAIQIKEIRFMPPVATRAEVKIVREAVILKEEDKEEITIEDFKNELRKVAGLHHNN